MVRMAKQGSGAASKEEKKAAKQAAKAARRERFSQIWQAFQMQRKEDKLLLPLMIGAVVVTALVLFGIGLLIGQEWFLLPTGVLLGVLLADDHLRPPGAEERLREGRGPARRRRLGARQHARPVARHPGRRRHHAARRRAPRHRPARRHPGRRGRAAPDEGPRRAGEEAHRPHRRAGADLRGPRRRRGGPGAALEAPAPRHQAPAQHRQEPDGDRREAPRRPGQPQRAGHAQGPDAQGRPADEGHAAHRAPAKRSVVAVSGSG